MSFRKKAVAQYFLDKGNSSIFKYFTLKIGKTEDHALRKKSGLFDSIQLKLVVLKLV